MTAPFVVLQSVSKDFSGVHALSDVNLTIDEGEVVSLCGENGSGKSTLIKILAGVHAPSAGKLLIDGVPMNRFGPSDAAHAGIRVIFQDFSLFPNLSVAENVAFASQVPGRVARISRRRNREIAARALARIGVQLDVDTPASELSMVDRQLVAIAAALAQEARLIIMDEPTTALSRREIQALLDVIRGLKADNIATLFVSHKLDEVAEVSDRTVVIRDGRKIEDRPASSFNRESLTVAMTGRAINYGSTNLAEPQDEVALRVEGLTAPSHFREVSFILRRGEILGITGLLGSGRNALALSLFGMLPPSAGTVSVDDAPVELSSIQAAIAAGIGLVPEDRLTEGLFLDHPIRDNIVVRTIDQLKNRAGMTSPRRNDQVAREWVDRLRIKTPTVTQAVSTLSGGNQQRVVLARWLSADPRVLILNGPTVGVDVGSKRQIIDLLVDLAQAGMAIIVTSDDIPELLEVSHRIFVMRDGAIAEQFDRAQIDESSLNTLLVAS
jgi:simple sugar transport system ATP-binding protein